MCVVCIVIFLLVLLLVLFWVQQIVFVLSQEISGQVVNSEEVVILKVLLEDICCFVVVYNVVCVVYVDLVDDKKLMQLVVCGLLFDFDLYSIYFNKEDVQVFDEQVNGVYEGIGVELQQQLDNVSMKVIVLIDDMLVVKVGIFVGDLIIVIDGKLISVIDVSELLCGLVGSKVVLIIVCDGKLKLFDVSLICQIICVISVCSCLFELGYGYICLSIFQVDIGLDFQKYVQQLQKQFGGQFKGLVLDLCSNLGGLLMVVVQVVDDLFDKGNIVSICGCISISDVWFDVILGDLLKGVLVVVLVDVGLVSVLEVFVGVLCDNKCVCVVGSCIFGKGLVQIVLLLDNGDLVKLIIVCYYMFSGKLIQVIGIVLDVELKFVVMLVEDVLLVSLSDYSEVILLGYLCGDDEGIEGYYVGVVLLGDGLINDVLVELKNLGLVVVWLKVEVEKVDVIKVVKVVVVKLEVKVEFKLEVKLEVKFVLVLVKF